MRMVDIIEKKKHGEKLSNEQISFWIDGLLNGDVPEYQTSALLMAIYFKGMDIEETAELTMKMMHSGEVVDLSQIPGIKVDKHSTGGVGDTTTLILAPAVAACGVPVAKMSGRGLGHTGGTLDKLESLPGVSVEKTPDEMIDMVKKNGVAVIGQSGNLVPADKALYALRDVTSTVDNVSLIASSIMSKKLASGSDAIVLDVKVGSGAFMTTVEKGIELATTMVGIAEHLNKKCTAIITDMNQPLGMKIGNAIEVQEAIEVLRCEIDFSDPLVEVSALLGAQMLVAAEACEDIKAGKNMFFDAIKSGKALGKFKLLIDSLGGDGTIIDRPDSLSKAKTKEDILADESGWISSINAMEIGRAAQMLGAGRAVASDLLDPDVGIVMHKRVGDKIQKGEVICSLHMNNEKNRVQVSEIMRDSVKISDRECEKTPMVYAIVNSDGVQRL